MSTQLLVWMYRWVYWLTKGSQWYWQPELGLTATSKSQWASLHSVCSTFLIHDVLTYSYSTSPNFILARVPLGLLFFSFHRAQNEPEERALICKYTATLFTYFIIRNMTLRFNTVADNLHADMKIGSQSPALASVTHHLKCWVAPVAL